LTLPFAMNIAHTFRSWQELNLPDVSPLLDCWTSAARKSVSRNY